MSITDEKVRNCDSYPQKCNHKDKAYDINWFAHSS